VLDEPVLRVLRRLEEEDERERAAGVEHARRARQVAPTTGRFLFSLVAVQNACEVLELGGSRGYSAIWLAAGARILGGSVTSIERDPERCATWRRNVEEAGLAEWARLVEGDAFDVLEGLEDVFDVVFLDAEKDDYEALFGLARPRLEAGGLVVADNVLSHAETLTDYSRRRQGDPGLSSVTVPLDRGLELTTILGHATSRP
jgi:predicted O-methyltransferase YrrM